MNEKQNENRELLKLQESARLALAGVNPKWTEEEIAKAFAGTPADSHIVAAVLAVIKKAKADIAEQMSAPNSGDAVRAHCAGGYFWLDHLAAEIVERHSAAFPQYVKSLKK